MHLIIDNLLIHRSSEVHLKSSASKSIAIPRFYGVHSLPHRLHLHRISSPGYIEYVHDLYQCNRQRWDSAFCEYELQFFRANLWLLYLQLCFTGFLAIFFKTHHHLFLNSIITRPQGQGTKSNTVHCAHIVIWFYEARRTRFTPYLAAQLEAFTSETREELGESTFCDNSVSSILRSNGPMATLGVGFFYFGIQNRGLTRRWAEENS